MGTSLAEQIVATKQAIVDTHNMIDQHKVTIERGLPGVTHQATLDRHRKRHNEMMSHLSKRSHALTATLTELHARISTGEVP